MLEKMAFLCLPALVLVVLGTAFVLSRVFPFAVEDRITQRSPRPRAAA